MAVSCMRQACGHNYRNNSFIVDVAMGQYHVPQNVFLVFDVLKFLKKNTFKPTIHFTFKGTHS